MYSFKNVTVVRSNNAVTYTFSMEVSSFEISISPSNELSWKTQGYFSEISSAVAFVIEEEKRMSREKIFAWVPNKAHHIIEALYDNGFCNTSSGARHFRSHLYQLNLL